jgi:hypothetical protein
MMMWHDDMACGDVGVLMWYVLMWRVLIWRLQFDTRPRTTTPLAELVGGEGMLASCSRPLSAKGEGGREGGVGGGVLDAAEAALADKLAAAGQAHLFAHWPAPGVADSDKGRMMQQLIKLDQSYAGGLVAYVGNAQQVRRLPRVPNVP